MALISTNSRLPAFIAPAVALAALFESFLGHRHDYTGHFLAGYGATLAMYLFWLWRLPANYYASWKARSILPICLVCILLGVATELTIFRIAKFDEIDFCNQSLGAVLAGTVTLAFVASERPPEIEFAAGLVISSALLLAGAFYAFV